MGAVVNREFIDEEIRVATFTAPHRCSILVTNDAVNNKYPLEPSVDIHVHYDFLGVVYVDSRLMVKGCKPEDLDKELYLFGNVFIQEKKQWKMGIFRRLYNHDSDTKSLNFKSPTFIYMIE